MLILEAQHEPLAFCLPLLSGGLSQSSQTQGPWAQSDPCEVISRSGEGHSWGSGSAQSQPQLNYILGKQPDFPAPHFCIYKIGVIIVDDWEDE